MTPTQITFFFLGILSVIGAAMVVHSWIDKKRIRKSFLRLAAELSGGVVQENPLVYPRFSGEIGGRRFDLFFTVVKVGRQHILYYIYSLKSEIASDLLLLKSDFFKPVADEAEFSEKAGTILSDVDPRYQARSQHPEVARRLLEEASVQEPLNRLEEFSSLQLGPDALVVGKPYEGLPDIDPGHILRNVQALVKLAEAMEHSPAAA